MREVRLAGGPLSGATGRYLAAAARDALRQCYGFDIDTRRVADGKPAGLDAYRSARALDQLRACRDLVAQMDKVFEVETLIEQASPAFDAIPMSCRIGVDAVAEILERESAVLGLTRESDGRFRRWDVETSGSGLQ